MNTKSTARAPRGSNARTNQDYFARRIAELLVLSTEAEGYGYRELGHHCDMAAQALTEALNEVTRLANLSPEERHALGTDEDSE